VKKIFIIIIHYQGLDLTGKCLESLQRIESANNLIETIVVVNNSQENMESLRAEFSQVKFMMTGENLGFSAGNNIGIRYALKAEADYVILLNNDTLVDSGFVVALIEAAEKYRQGGIFSPKIYFAPGYEFHHDRYRNKDRGKVIWFAGGEVDWANIATPHRGVDEVDHGQYDRIKKIEFASFCATLIKSNVFKQIGLLDERYFLYYEDADFCQRAIRAGFDLFYVPASRVWHQVAASSKIGGVLQDYFMVRNQLLFGWSFAPWRAKFALFKQSLKFLIFGRPWQRKAVIDFCLRKFGRGSWPERL